MLSSCYLSKDNRLFHISFTAHFIISNMVNTSFFFLACLLAPSRLTAFTVVPKENHSCVRETKLHFFGGLADAFKNEDMGARQNAGLSGVRTTLMLIFPTLIMLPLRYFEHFAGSKVQ